MILRISNYNKKENFPPQRRKRKVLLLFVGVLTAVMLLLSSGCSDKSMEFVAGTWRAKDIEVGELTINQLDFVIRESSQSSECIITSAEQDYELQVLINEETVAELSATYYSKTLRLAFLWGQNDFTVSAVMKKNDDAVFIDATIHIVSGNTFSEQHTESIQVVLHEI